MAELTTKKIETEPKLMSKLAGDGSAPASNLYAAYTTIINAAYTTIIRWLVPSWNKIIMFEWKLRAANFLGEFSST